MRQWPMQKRRPRASRRRPRDTIENCQPRLGGSRWRGIRSKRRANWGGTSTRCETCTGSSDTVCLMRINVNAWPFDYSRSSLTAFGFAVVDVGALCVDGGRGARIDVGRRACDFGAAVVATGTLSVFDVPVRLCRSFRHSTRRVENTIRKKHRLHICNTLFDMMLFSVTCCPS